MLKLFLIIFSSILIVILLAVVIWRIYTNKKMDLDKGSMKLLSQKSVEKFHFFAMLNNLKLFINILIKNPHAKVKKSLIPAIIVTDKKIYILSEIIFSNNQEIINLNSENKYQEIEKLLSKYKVTFEIIFIKNNPNSMVKNSTNYPILTFEELGEKIKFESEKMKNNIDQLKWINFFKRNNLLSSDKK
ncbi:hypothetical protein NV226_00740 [Mycoplasma iguanae]|uniref:DUF2726 domain-containing protein n=1 Tax=Mycoplasma iguanae TaxID=292461 RepID=A0ABY5R8L0_9MOLU|nr:hypothetical protein [Mycoplasma iguanae]UVD81828.1 hypothetical protein NV226_00740 [Mycoplasma iguanae]